MLLVKTQELFCQIRTVPKNLYPVQQQTRACISEKEVLHFKFCFLSLDKASYINKSNA